MKPLDTSLLRWNQREEMKAEKQEMESVLGDPIRRSRLQNPGAVQRMLGKMEKQLEAQAPEPLQGLEKDQVSRRVKELESKIKENMPPAEVMRKNPPGAVEWHMRWEKANKPAIKQWKNGKLQLEPDSQDPDLANIETLRNGGALGAFRSDAQITGHMSYGNIPEEKWPFEPPQNTALKQNERVTQEVVAVVETKRGRAPWTEEQKESARQRLALAREKKAAKRHMTV